MRIELKWILVSNGMLLVYLLFQIADLALLADDNPREGIILEPELRPVQYDNSTGQGPVPDRPLLIPKIIHQTYKTQSIPEKWQATQQSCINTNEEYEYMFWTDESARQFIEKHYKWFLKTYDSYRYPIQRVDSVRYFLLAHYGGVYIDLDCGCNANIDAMLAFPAFVRKTDPTGVSNDVMGSVPKHPFFLKVITELEKYNRNWFISYLTVMYSTGPLFLSVIWQKYRRLGLRPEWSEVRVLYPRSQKLKTTAIFYDRAGSSWHESDAKILIFMDKHIILTVLFFTTLVLGLLYLQFRFYQYLLNSPVRRHRVLAFIQRHIRRLQNRFQTKHTNDDQLMHEFRSNV